MPVSVPDDNRRSRLVLWDDGGDEELVPDPVPPSGAVVNA